MARPFLFRQHRVQKNLLFRFVFIIGIGILALFPFHPPVNAQSGDAALSFGIRPTKAHEQRPESFAYFSYGLSPGVQVDDEAIVINSGSETITLKFYAADGITNQNGGTGFTEQGTTSPGGSGGVSHWISLSTNEITIAPGEELLMPFTLSVPADARPGHHIAGLVVESFPVVAESPVIAEGEALFAVNVIHRVGVAVVIHVPGTQVTGLEITGLDLLQQDENGATAILTVQNTGNIYMDATGFVLISDKKQNILANLPIDLDTILPGDEAVFYLSLPVELNDSDYLLHASLQFEGGAAVIENIEVKIRKGQPAGEDGPSGPALPATITKIFSSSSVDIFIYKNRFVLFGLLGLIGITEIALFVHYFRKKTK